MGTGAGYSALWLALACRATGRKLTTCDNDPAEAEIARHMDWPADRKLPGYTQLMRPCDIDGSRAYHLTTFFEKGGIVTVLAFEQPQQIPDGQGWWANTYWQVVRSREGRPLVLIAQKKQALAVASRALGAPEKVDG